MKPVTVAVAVDRSLAILAGKAHYGETTIEVDPSLLNEDERKELTTLFCTGDVMSLIHVGNGTRLPAVAAADMDSVRFLLAEHRKAREAYVAEKERQKAQKQAEYAAAVDAWLDAADEDCIRCDCGTWRVMGQPVAYSHNGTVDDPRVMERVIRLKEECKRRNDEIAARREKDEADRRAQVEAQGAQQTAEVSAWVAEHGTRGQKERHKRGLLPRDEALHGLRAIAFAPLDEFARYKRIKADEIGALVDPDQDITYETGTASSATDSEFESLERIESALKAAGRNAVCEMREHRALIDGEPALTKRSVHVTITWGAFTFSREYAAG